HSKEKWKEHPFLVRGGQQLCISLPRVCIFLPTPTIQGNYSLLDEGGQTIFRDRHFPDRKPAGLVVKGRISARPGQSSFRTASLILEAVFLNSVEAEKTLVILSGAKSPGISFLSLP